MESMRQPCGVQRERLQGHRSNALVRMPSAWSGISRQRTQATATCSVLSTSVCRRSRAVNHSDNHFINQSVNCSLTIAKNINHSKKRYLTQPCREIKLLRPYTHMQCSKCRILCGRVVSHQQAASVDSETDHASRFHRRSACNVIWTTSKLQQT